MHERSCQHADSRHDAARRVLVDAGHWLLRFWNAEVLTETDSVCDKIMAALEGRLESYAKFKGAQP